MDEIRELSHEFRDLIYDMPFQIPQNLLFLGRCVGILSGICTGLNPQFNLWDHIAPFASKIILEEARSGYQFWLEEFEKIARSILSMPKNIDSVLKLIEGGHVVVRTPEVNHRIQNLEKSSRSVTFGVIFSALLLGSIQLYLNDEILLSTVLMASAIIDLALLLRNNLK